MGDPSDDVGRQAVQISNALTRNHREHFGRGAGTVKTVINKGFGVRFDPVVLPGFGSIPNPPA